MAPYGSIVSVVPGAQEGSDHGAHVARLQAEVREVFLQPLPHHGAVDALRSPGEMGVSTGGGGTPPLILYPLVN